MAALAAILASFETMGRVALLLSLCIPVLARRTLPDGVASADGAAALLQTERSSEAFPVARALNIFAFPVGHLENNFKPLTRTQVDRRGHRHRAGVGSLGVGVAGVHETPDGGGSSRAPGPGDGGVGASRFAVEGGGSSGGGTRSVDRDAGSYDGEFGVVKAHDQSGTAFDLPVPIGWEDRLKNANIRNVRDRPSESIYTTDLASSSSWPVLLKVMCSDLSVSRREVLVAMRMEACRRVGRCNRGRILRYLDGETVGDRSYALVEAEIQTLTDFINSNIRRTFRLDVRTGHRAARHGTGRLDVRNRRHTDQIIVPLEESIPIMAVILQSLLDLEEAGMLHGAVAPANIIYSQGEVALGGLGSVCLSDDGNHDLSCSSARRSSRWAPGDPLWQPPEVHDGVPKGPKDHVWQAGLLFTMMCTGSNPVEDALWPRIPTLNDVDAWKEQRMKAWDYFAVDQDVIFGKIEQDQDIRELILHMLAPNPDKRLSTAEALAAVELVAGERGIDIVAGVATGGSEASASPPATARAADKAGDSDVDPWGSTVS